MSAIFGGQKQKSTSQNKSWNEAFPFIQDQFGGATKSTGLATTAITALLGLGGDEDGAAEAFSNYRNSTGYDFMMDQGQKAITGSAAAKGLLQSGSTARGLTSFGQNLAKTSFGDYLGQLLGLSNQGLQAGQLITGAGSRSEGTSQSSGSSKPGIGKFLGTVGAGIAASDRRLKTNVKKAGELSNGLTVYTYDYINGKGPYIGVMADEVEKIKPEALGPVIDGYATVDYGKIWETA